MRDAIGWIVVVAFVSIALIVLAAVVLSGCGSPPPDGAACEIDGRPVDCLGEEWEQMCGG